jgi:hypothetical protein
MGAFRFALTIVLVLGFFIVELWFISGSTLSGGQVWRRISIGSTCAEPIGRAVTYVSGRSQLMVPLLT